MIFHLCLNVGAFAKANEDLEDTLKDGIQNLINQKSTESIKQEQKKTTDVPAKVDEK